METQPMLLPFPTAQIAIENTAFHFDRPFTYRIPENLHSKIRPGCRVAVPFGAGNTLRQGMVLSCEKGQA